MVMISYAEQYWDGLLIACRDQTVAATLRETKDLQTARCTSNIDRSKGGPNMNLH